MGFLRIQALVWSTYGLVHYLAAIPVFAPDEVPAFAALNVVKATSGLLASSALWVVLDRRVGGIAPRGLPAIVGLSAVAAAAIWVALDRGLLMIAEPMLGLTIPWSHLPHGFDLEYLFVMSAWSAAAVVLTQREREASLRQALLEQQVTAQEALLHAMAAKLNPHFLFNTLNTIRSLITDDPGRAREMLTRLSTFLRHVLTFDPTVPVPLGVEIELARAYLDVERARFEDSLAVQIDVTPEGRQALVPPLLLQPLVENALQHAPGCGARDVRVLAAFENGRLIIEVSNAGSLAARSDEQANGLGLSLTRQRLAHLYGSRTCLVLSEHEGRVSARIEIDQPAMAESGGPRDVSPE